jgi:adenine-specific DNA-methyltransferase
MKGINESLYDEISQFTNGSVAGILQLLVAAAERRTFQRIIDCPTYPIPAKTSGLAVVVRHLREGMTSREVHVPTLLARLYESVRGVDERKRVGQFFTSAKVASWALKLAPPVANEVVCDAGAGAGVFADAILRTDVSLGSYIGVENDPILALCAAHTLESIGAPVSYKIWYANFLLLSRSEFARRGLGEPTLVIANPPFVRFHNLRGRAQIRATLKTRLGVMLSPLSGSGGYFLLRAAELVSSSNPVANGMLPDKRLLFFLPKEAAGAAHSRQLRDDLHRLHGWTWRKHRIPGVQTGINRHKSNALALLFVFEQKKIRSKVRSKSNRIPVVRDVLQIKRGLSTGRNDFFVLTQDQVKSLKLPKHCLRAVLPTRIPLKKREFSLEDWDHLRLAGRPCWLLTLPTGNIEDFEISIQEYLKEGIRRGVHATPTAKTLRTWFSLPIPLKPPDAFVTYLFRGAPRFILNRARVLHLTNILGGRFASPTIDFEHEGTIIDALNVQAEKWIVRNPPGREYKGGLRKIEPRELSMLPVEPSIVELLNRERAAAIAKSGSLFDKT